MLNFVDKLVGRITGEGTGGAAGFARGGAWVTLAEDGDATVLSYEADAQVGGKLAQIGSRLIQGTARKLAGQFFDRFAEAVGQNGAEGEEGTTWNASTFARWVYPYSSANALTLRRVPGVYVWG